MVRLPTPEALNSEYRTPHSTFYPPLETLTLETQRYIVDRKNMPSIVFDTTMIQYGNYNKFSYLKAYKISLYAQMVENVQLFNSDAFMKI